MVFDQNLSFFISTYLPLSAERFSSGLFALRQTKQQVELLWTAKHNLPGAKRYTTKKRETEVKSNQVQVNFHMLAVLTVAAAATAVPTIQIAPVSCLCL